MANLRRHKKERLFFKRSLLQKQKMSKQLTIHVEFWHGIAEIQESSLLVVAWEIMLMQYSNCD